MILNPLHFLPRALFLITLLAAGWMQVLAQAPNSFRHLQKVDGLSQSSVFSIAQDSAGFMWFGTRDGLNRYDGHSIRVYRPDSNGLGPIGNDVRSLFYDQIRGGMWVGTTDGLSFYCPRTDLFRNHPEVKGAIRDIHQNQQGDVWITAASGLYLYKVATAQLEPVKLLGLKGDPHKITTVVEANDTLWLASNHGVYMATRNGEELNYKTKRLLLGDDEVNNQRFEAIYLTSNGTLFLGTFENGVYRYDLKSGNTINYRHKSGDPTTIGDNNVRAILPDDRGGLWIATFNGLSRLDITTETIQTDRANGLRGDELSDNSLHCLFKDDHGSLWVGSYYGGVNHLDPIYSRFRSYVKTQSSSSLGADIVSAFAEDEKGNIYVGTEGAGLDFLDIAADTFTHFRPSTSRPNFISGSNVKSLLLDDDKLWIGTYKEGLSVLDLSSGQFRKFRAKPYADQGNPIEQTWLSNNNVYSLIRYGKYIWAATYGGGLSLLNTETQEFRNFTHDENDPASIPSNFVGVIYRKNARFWVATDAGLFHVIVNDVGLPIRFESVLEGKRVRVVHADDKGTLWAGTLNAGLFRIEGNGADITQYTTEDGLAGNTVFGILGDEQGKLWLSTNDGLSRFDPKTGRSTNFERPSGMTTGEFNYGAFLKTSKGEFLFGGLDGFTMFHPSNIKERRKPSPLAFTDLQKNGQVIRPGKDALLEKSIDNTDGLTLAYNDANFTVGLAALDFLNPESNTIEYKLDGIDADWKTAKGKVEATYTLQREGDYTFLARTFTGDGHVKSETRELNITVLPPPWRTWWAYFGYLCLLLGCIYGVLRFVRLRHNYELEHLARQRDEELHEGKLRFFTNITHEFRTPLTLILGPLGDLLQDKTLTPSSRAKLSSIERNSRRLLGLVDRVLTFRKLASEHGRLRGSRNDLNWFLRKLHEPFSEEARRRGLTLNLDAEVDSLWVWFDTRMLEMAVAGLLSNALKFAPDNGTITLSGKRISEDQVEICVVDDGPGISDELKPQIFKRFFEDPSQSHVTGSGIGLSVASDLVALHQGSIHVEDTPGGGATFVIQFPVGKEHFSKAAMSETLAQQEESHLEVVQELELTEESSATVVAGEAAEALLDEQEKSRILIVEDNEELRTYLGEIFEPFYEVELAADGREGLAKALSVATPDIVVSDVMMPYMDGFELCEKIKTNLKVSHVPVLLLTAKTGEHARLDGLRIGADDYIPKPFVPEELLLRVRNTLDTRKRVRETFSRVINLDPKEISVTSADEEFLMNALAFVEDHIDDLELNVVRMASALNVSRALLFTKLKSLTNQTPGNFIKGLRIKRAAQLLATNKLNVAEVAYRVGFRDPKYFSKCFKEEYGVSALGYMKQQVAE